MAQQSFSSPLRISDISVFLIVLQAAGLFSFHINVPGAPVNLHWKVHNQSVIEVEWTRPLSTNGLIINYWVEFRLTNETQNLTSNGSWLVKPTSNTSIFLNDLQRNEYYAVRVKAETKDGVGEPSEVILVKIWNKIPEHPPPRDQLKPETELPFTHSQQILGVVIGVALSVFFISASIAIIRRIINGNGDPPSAKRSLEHLNSLDMKVSVEIPDMESHSGHPVPNRSVPRASNSPTTRANTETDLCSKCKNKIVKSKNMKNIQSRHNF